MSERETESESESEIEREREMVERGVLRVRGGLKYGRYFAVFLCSMPTYEFLRFLVRFSSTSKQQHYHAKKTWLWHSGNTFSNKKRFMKSQAGTAC